MTDTTSTQSIDINDRIAKLEATMQSGLEKLTDGLNRFSTAVVTTLSGQPATAPAQTAGAPAKRRGRPPKSASQAAAAPVQRERDLTSDELYAVDLVKRAGRMTQTELADTLKIERSLVQARMKEPIKRGLVVAQLIEPRNGHRHVLYRRADWCSFKGE